MSLLSGFKNPWESGGALDSGVLSDNALKNNVLNNEISTSPEVAVKSDKFKLGNLIILLMERVPILNTDRSYLELYLKDNLEKNNKVWDYVTTLGLGTGKTKTWIPDYINNIKNKQSTEEIKKGQLHNIVIVSHGNVNQLKLDVGTNGWLEKENIDEYMKGTLNQFTGQYQIMKLFDVIRDSIVDGGNILFYGCSAGVSNSISDSFAKYFTKEEKVVNMFFNRNYSQGGNKSINGKRYKYITWNSGLTFEASPSWQFVQSAQKEENIKTKTVSYDLALKTQSSFDAPPYYDLIYPIYPSETNWFGW